MSSTKKSSPKKAAVKTAKTKTKGKRCKCAAPNRFLGGLVVIILGAAATTLIAALIIFTTIGLGRKLNVETSARRFAAEYTTVDKDNPFLYASADGVINIIEHGTGVIYLGFPSCEWCQAYAGYLSEAAKDAGLSTIYYYNIESDRDNNTEVYQKLVSLLSGNLQYDESGNRRIYVPDVVFVVDGRIIGNDLETSKDTAGVANPADYWTEARVAALKSRLVSNMKQVIDASGCEDNCNK
ncbi:hypothetical protein IKW75_00380 [Candidatus Saccharibacteria bacterium]|nr:hypothetical protein [Candidatus Saccharibacteria bacterium]